jgi:hypothetical protein
VGTLFAAFLGYNPIQQLLGPNITGALPADNVATLTGREFFPHLISAPFHDGLSIVFTLAIVMGVVAAVASVIRGRRPANPGPIDATTEAAEAQAESSVASA